MMARACPVPNGEVNTKPPQTGTPIVTTTDENAVQTASDILCRGGVVALPTDTIYGVCCAVNNTNAINKIYQIKGRSFSKPLAICVSCVQEIPKCVDIGGSETILSKLLPGGVTIVLPRTSSLNPALNPGFQTVGVRVPDYHFVLDLCTAVRGPIALTSANISNGPNSTCIEEFKEIWDDLDLIVDGGQLPLSVGSTVVEISDHSFSVIRPGRDYEKTLKVLSEEHHLENRSSRVS
ncbi:threonylcarbamoyl-AMP synthase-like [Bolinopsis microptera]|uniref:threonylcarbamoyl-AMP synthase-like n=1 Tax=Bolinopsis microptera TaxID=2820187 RepID=UPI0030799128